MNCEGGIAVNNQIAIAAIRKRQQQVMGAALLNGYF